jgi:hypothetical protein
MIRDQKNQSVGSTSQALGEVSSRRINEVIQRQVQNEIGQTRHYKRLYEESKA